MRAGVIHICDVVAEGHRLTGSFHVSEDQHALASLRRVNVPKPRVADLVRGRGVFRGPIFARHFVESGGEPYMPPSNILNADARPAGYLSLRHGKLLENLRLHAGMILVTCSGMNLGSVIWADHRLDGVVASHDLIRIEPDPAAVPPGFLFAFLASRHGHTLIRKQIYGGHIKHIEPEHVANLQVPRLGHSIESHADELVSESSKLMAEFQSGVNRATRRLFSSVGLDDITAADWHLMGRGTAFSEERPSTDSLRALNFSPRYRRLLAKIRKGRWKALGEICLPGTLRSGGRFKRIDAEPEFSYRLVGQKEIFYIRPEGRWIARATVGNSVLVPRGTVMIAAQGTLGESELYCRAEFIYGRAEENAYSQHFVRAVADESVMLRGCLFAFLRSETAFRMLRSISIGTKLQDLHPKFRAELPVPYPDREVQEEIHRIVVDAYAARDKAVTLQDQAIALVEDAIETGAK